MVLRVFDEATMVSILLSDESLWTAAQVPGSRYHPKPLVRLHEGVSP